MQSAGAPTRIALRPSTIATIVALLVLVLLGAFVRFLGIDFGRPFAYHPDEGTIARAAMEMVQNRDWNPHVFFYPSLLSDIEAVVVAVGRLLGGAPLETNQSWLFGSEALPGQFRYFLSGRLVVAMLGLLTIVVTFAIGARSHGARVGIIAAAIVALAPLHITSSRYLTTDVPLTLLCALTLLASIEAQRRTGDRWWLLASAIAGLAISTKWNGVVILVVPLVAYLSCAADLHGVGARLRRRTPYLMLAAAAASLLVTTPAILFDTATVRDYLVLQGELYARVRPNERSSSFVFHVGALMDGLGPIAALGGIVGSVAIVVGRFWRDLAIPVFIVAYFIAISLPATHFERNLLPIVPYLAVAFGLVSVRSIDRVALARPRVGGIPTKVILGGLATAVVALALLPGFWGSVAVGRTLTATDTRTLAREWLLGHVPRKTIVAREQYTPQLTPDEYRLRNHDFLWQRNMAWYRDQGVRYLVTSSLEYGRFYGNPDAPSQDAFYTELFSLPEVFRADPGPDRPGPTIRIFELPPATAPPS